MTISARFWQRPLALALLGGLAVSGPVMLGPVMAGPIMPGPATMAAIDARPDAGIIQFAAMDELPTVPQEQRRRRGGGRRAKGKDKPYQPLAKDVQGESADAHKDYLKRNGF